MKKLNWEHYGQKWEKEKQEGKQGRKAAKNEEEEKELRFGAGKIKAGR